MEGYSCKIVETNMELDAKERIKMKDLSNAKALDSEIPEIGDAITISPIGYVDLEVHNEKSENTDYNVFVLVTQEEKYYTSSESLRTSYMEIVRELEEANYTDYYEIEIYRKESKNYKGKGFLTCSLL